MRRAGLWVLFLLAPALAMATESGQLPEVGGAFSVMPIRQHTCVAAWLSVPIGQRLVGLQWYNNDAGTTFQDVTVVHGYEEFADGEGYHFGSVTAGVSEGWVQRDLSEGVESLSGRLLVVFVLPSGAVYEHGGEGGGPGFAFLTGSHPSLLDISLDGNEWVSVERQMALVGELSSDQLATSEGGGEKTTAVAEPLVTGLRRTFPNPANPKIVFEYSLAQDAKVGVNVFNLKGEWVATLVDTRQGRGIYTVTWEGRDSRGLRVASGVYLLRFQAGSYLETTKVVISR